MSTWDPGQYLKFAGPRLRPALDLLARIQLETPAVVFDLGCGAGNVTRALTARWPGAAVTGVDGSPEMLARAREHEDAITWVEAAIEDWTPPAPADLIFSNAALHWLDDHRALFPRLAAGLAPGGVLAVQMPRNYREPTHVALDEVARNGPWAARLGAHLRPQPVAAPEAYYDMLAPVVATVDIWESIYVQALEGDNPVVEWVKGSALKPLLDLLDEGQRAAFLAAYSARIAAAYPRRADGVTLLPFRRLFMVAVK